MGRSIYRLCILTSFLLLILPFSLTGQSLPWLSQSDNSSVESLIWQSRAAGVDGNWQESLELFLLARSASESTNHTSGGSQPSSAADSGRDWRGEQLILQALADDRGRFTGDSQSSYRIAVVFLDAVGDEELAPHTESAAEMYFGYQQAWIPLLSHGQWQWDIEYFRPGFTVDRLEPDGTFLPQPDIRRIVEQKTYQEFMAHTLNDFDAYVFVWPHVSGTATQATGGDSPQDFFLGGWDESLKRGVVLIPDSWILSHLTQKTLLHEIFHSIERNLGLYPFHPWRSENRSSIPGFTGESELEYYQWRFDTVMADYGWENINYRKRYPLRLPGESWTTLRDAYLAGKPSLSDLSGKIHQSPNLSQLLDGDLPSWLDYLDRQLQRGYQGYAPGAAGTALDDLNRIAEYLLGIWMNNPHILDVQSEIATLKIELATEGFQQLEAAEIASLHDMIQKFTETSLLVLRSNEQQGTRTYWEDTNIILRTDRILAALGDLQETAGSAPASGLHPVSSHQTMSTLELELLQGQADAISHRVYPWRVLGQFYLGLLSNEGYDADTASAAASAFRKGLEIRPGSYREELGLALSELWSGDISGALDRYEGVYRQYPVTGRQISNDLLFASYRETSNVSKAQLLSAAVIYRPDSTWAWRGLGEALRSAVNSNEASTLGSSHEIRQEAIAAYQRSADLGLEQSIESLRRYYDISYIPTPAGTAPGFTPHSDALRIGVYSPYSTDTNQAQRWFTDAFSMQPDFILEYLSPNDILSGALDRLDVLIVPGGMADDYMDPLGGDGMNAIVRFINGGGGYLGLCAGAYCALAPRLLDMGNIGAFDMAHWFRGNGDVRIDLSQEGLELFSPTGDSADGSVNIRYANGPLMPRAEELAVLNPQAEVLATYASGMAQNGAPDIMTGRPAIIRYPQGSGRVLLSAPHPEYTYGLEVWLRQMVLWAAGEL